MIIQNEARGTRATSQIASGAKSGVLVAKPALVKYPFIRRFCADAGCRKSFERDAMEQLGPGVDIVARNNPGWEVLPKRWVVERTFSWLNNSRRLSKDYEISADSAETIVWISHIHTLIKRL